MNNLSKVVLTGSIVLGAALFSIGCGGDSSCCEPTKPPTAIIGGFPSSGVLGANEHRLTINGTQSKDDGNIVAYEWTVDDVFASKEQSPTLDLGNPGRHKVCLKVTDNDNLTHMTCEYITVPELNGPTPVISPTMIKSGCPLDGSSSVSHSASGEIRGYKWTLNSLDSTTVSTASTYTVPNLTTATKVCLTVTDSNGEENGICQDIIPHDAPTAVLNVLESTGSNPTSISEATLLQRGTAYNLSCAGSTDDCPIADDNLSCQWQARSYFVEGDDCSATPQTNYISDCFSTDNGHSGFGDTTTTPTTHTFVQLCGADSTKYKCVEFTLTVKDNKHNITASPIKKVFHVEN
jgi:hypothetical protein